MTNGVKVKICGLASLADAQLAAEAGADYLGFVVDPKLPRSITLATFQALKSQLPPGPKKVGVVTYSSMDELEQYKNAGFDFIQLRFPNDTPFFEVAIWTEIIPPQKLWLAPVVPAGKELDPAFFPLADHMVIEAVTPDAWAECARLRERFSRVNWVLEGGLTPESVADAAAATHASIITVDGGVESATGTKDRGKLMAFFENLKNAQLS